MNSYWVSKRETKNGLEKLKKALSEADTVIVGAGAGLSTSAGLSYAGERFDRWFSDFAVKYDIRDMYSGGFYPYPDMETFWAWWSRHIWVNRYAPIPNDTYALLLDLVKDKDYFVLTTNVDHCFQRSGFDKKQLFYTQGDCGLLQSSNPKGPSAHKTYDNEDLIRKMLLAQGFEITEENDLVIPDGTKPLMRIPSDLIPYCPDDGELMTTNLRSDDTFVEDEGWHRAAERYTDFIRRHKGTKTVFLECGVGGNTPGIIKFNFWNMTSEWPDATYACLNYGEACTADDIVDKSICINGDLKEILAEL